MQVMTLKRELQSQKTLGESPKLENAKTLNENAKNAEVLKILKAASSTDNSKALGRACFLTALSSSSSSIRSVLFETRPELYTNKTPWFIRGAHGGYRMMAPTNQKGSSVFSSRWQQYRIVDRRALVWCKHDVRHG
jgi:hypothetical protein